MVVSEKGNILTLYPKAPSGAQPYRLYTAIDGDTFDTLAHRFYGDSRLWWRIADMNPQVHFPTDLVPGTMIRVPLQ